MIALLTIAALAGMTFQCEADTAYLTVFAPAEEVTADYHGNVLTLYTVEGDGEILPPPFKIKQVFDSLPDELFMLVETQEFPIEITISNIDSVAQMADIGLSATSESGETQSISGTCMVTQNAGEVVQW